MALLASEEILMVLYFVCPIGILTLLGFVLCRIIFLRLRLFTLPLK